MSNSEAASAAPSHSSAQGREKRRGAVVGRRRSSMRDNSLPPGQEKQGGKKEAASATPLHSPGQGREKRRGAVVGQGRSNMKDNSYPPGQERGGKKGKSSSGGGGVKRLTKEHSFLTDVADVRAMEQGLLQLLGDFHSGKLRAFNEGATFEKMDEVREQQERLARLHFELDVLQDIHRLGTEEARTTANENLSKLVDQLHNLSMSIQTLQPGSTEKEEKKSKH